MNLNEQTFLYQLNLRPVQAFPGILNQTNSRDCVASIKDLFCFSFQKMLTGQVEARNLGDRCPFPLHLREDVEMVGISVQTFFPFGLKQKTHNDTHTMG